jgi:NAD(P)-dependent dehydrogenase (short-subunit alcohol dehydrogenase family)
MTRWNNKTVLVTGGSMGLGRAIAQTFAQAGAEVMIAARDEPRVSQAADALRGAGLRVLGIAADVTKDEDVHKLFDHIESTWGGLDVLVNCVGRSTRRALGDTTVEDFAQLLEINFLSAVRATMAALPYLRKSRGHVVLIGSLASKTASPYLGAYAASKFPLVAYAQQLRLEFGKEGLHTLLVCPGPIKRDDAGSRYDTESANLPDSARHPGGGVKLAGIDPLLLSKRIVRYCELRKPELVVPGRARLLFALAQLWPSLGDWFVRRMT